MVVRVFSAWGAHGVQAAILKHDGCARLWPPAERKLIFLFRWRSNSDIAIDAMWGWVPSSPLYIGRFSTRACRAAHGRADLLYKPADLQGRRCQEASGASEAQSGRAGRRSCAAPRSSPFLCCSSASLLQTRCIRRALLHREFESLNREFELLNLEFEWMPLLGALPTLRS